MSMDKNCHIILYLSDLWHYIINNLKNENVQQFSSFLLLSRRIDFSIVFEYHEFPYGLPKVANEIFQFFLNNSTLIVITKSLSDENRLNIFKRRFLKNYTRNFDKAERMAAKIAANSDNKETKSFIAFQKDINQTHRLLRLDIFHLNLINILN